jgi:hypothetical protein
MDNVSLTVKASMFHLLCIILSETCCGKNAEAAENGKIFQIISIFNTLSHTPELHVQHTKLLQSRPESAVCLCAILELYPALCWQKRRFTKSCENQGCSLTFFYFSSLCCLQFPHPIIDR